MNVLQTAPATLVRLVQEGESIAELMNEGKARTWIGGDPNGTRIESKRPSKSEPS